MGLFNDYASTLNLNEEAGYFNEAELAEEMEKLDGYKNFEFYSDDIDEMCIESLLINEKNFSNIMMVTAHEEFKQYVETGSDAITEASISGFFEKIKEMVDRAWEKIKSIFEKCLNTVKGWISSDRTFVEKYSETIKSADARCFKFFGYDVNAESLKDGVAFFDEAPGQVSAAIKQVMSEKITKKDSDIVKTVFGGRGKEAALEELRKDLGISRKSKITKLNASIVLEELKDGKDNKKAINAAYKAAKKAIAGLKKDIEFARRIQEKVTGKKDTAHQANYTMVGTLCSTATSFLQGAQRIFIKACNVHHHNCRKAAARAVRGVTDNDDTTNESFDFDNNTSSNREFGFIV